MRGKYQVMPDLTKEEFEALKQDIAERGVQVPVEYDEEDNILDGYHRVQACKELGIEGWPSVIREGLTEGEKRAHARKLNLARRHLTQKQKRHMIRDQLKETPENSDRQIATMLGVSNKTVSYTRKEMEKSGQLCKLHTSTGADGKEYPRKREAPEQPTPSTEEADTETPQDNTSEQAAIYLHSRKDKDRAGEILRAAKRGDEKAQKDVERLAAGQTTVKNAYRRLEQRKREEELEEPPIPDDKYRVLYADPPWKYNDKRDGHTTGAEDHYPTMTIQELCDLPIEDLALDTAVLFLWTTSPLLEDSFNIVNAWGFRYKTSFVKEGN